MGAGKTKRMPRAVREQQMLDAAVSVFGRHGYMAASMDEIAELAGVSKPLVYLYLNSKDDLFSACISREARALTEAVRAGVRPGLSADGQLWSGCGRSSPTPRGTRTPGGCCTCTPVRTGSGSRPRWRRCARRSSRS
ncbi:HTH-type transcriptional regulator BetI [Streptomyces tendae]